MSKLLAPTLSDVILPTKILSVTDRPYEFSFTGQSGREVIFRIDCANFVEFLLPRKLDHWPSAITISGFLDADFTLRLGVNQDVWDPKVVYRIMPSSALLLHELSPLTILELEITT